MEFKNRVALIIKNTGGVVRFAKATGISRRSLNMYVNGTSEPTRLNLIKMADVAKVCSSWLVGGKECMVCWHEPAWLEHFGEKNANGGNSQEPLFSLQVMFRWLKDRFNRGSNDLKLFEIIDDTMQPTLMKGALLIIDPHVASLKQVGALQQEAIYLLRKDDTIMVRRVQMLANGSVKILCDNDSYHDECIATEDLAYEVCGKVLAQISTL